jgi:starvation-inducible DNA-binding protein
MNIGILEENRSQTIDILNQLIADEHVLYIKTRNYHWNVTGSNFSELHAFFESQYTDLADSIDEIAERARMLGGFPIGSMAEFLELTRLKESANPSMTAAEMIADLLADHESIISNLRLSLNVVLDEYQDAGTSDFLTGLMQQHEKMAWMLRSF